MIQARTQIISAPLDEAACRVKSVFLAGSISTADTANWRETLCTSLSNLPITIYNPQRSDWDSSWRQDIEFAPFREQVEWELDMLGKADIVVFYFQPGTQAPISLLEFGIICAQVPGKAIVVCPEGFWKRGNVQITCEKFGVETVDDLEGLREAIVKRMPVFSRPDPDP
jgi:hypothetical protein